MATLFCPNCGRGLRADDLSDGAQVPCTGCGSTILAVETPHGISLVVPQLATKPLPAVDPAPVPSRPSSTADDYLQRLLKTDDVNQVGDRDIDGLASATRQEIRRVLLERLQQQARTGQPWPEFSRVPGRLSLVIRLLAEQPPLAGGTEVLKRLCDAVPTADLPRFFEDTRIPSDLRFGRLFRDVTATGQVPPGCESIWSVKTLGKERPLLERLVEALDVARCQQFVQLVTPSDIRDRTNQRMLILLSCLARSARKSNPKRDILTSYLMDDRLNEQNWDAILNCRELRTELFQAYPADDPLLSLKLVDLMERLLQTRGRFLANLEILKEAESRLPKDRRLELTMWAPVQSGLAELKQLASQKPGAIDRLLIGSHQRRVQQTVSGICASAEPILKAAYQINRPERQAQILQPLMQAHAPDLTLEMPLRTQSGATTSGTNRLMKIAAPMIAVLLLIAVGLIFRPRNSNLPSVADRPERLARPDSLQQPQPKNEPRYADPPTSPIVPVKDSGAGGPIKPGPSKGDPLKSEPAKRDVPKPDVPKRDVPKSDLPLPNVADSGTGLGKLNQVHFADSASFTLGPRQLNLDPPPKATASLFLVGAFAFEQPQVKPDIPAEVIPVIVTGNGTRQLSISIQDSVQKEGSDKKVARELFKCELAGNVISLLQGEGYELDLLRRPEISAGLSLSAIVVKEDDSIRSFALLPPLPNQEFPLVERPNAPDSFKLESDLKRWVQLLQKNNDCVIAVNAFQLFVKSRAGSARIFPPMKKETTLFTRALLPIEIADILCLSSGCIVPRDGGLQLENMEVQFSSVWNRPFSDKSDPSDRRDPDAFPSEILPVANLKQLFGIIKNKEAETNKARAAYNAEKRRIIEKKITTDKDLVQYYEELCRQTFHQPKKRRDFVEIAKKKLRGDVPDKPRSFSEDDLEKETARQFVTAIDEHLTRITSKKRYDSNIKSVFEFFNMALRNTSECSGDTISLACNIYAVINPVIDDTGTVTSGIAIKIASGKTPDEKKKESRR